MRFHSSIPDIDVAENGMNLRLIFRVIRRQIIYLTTPDVMGTKLLSFQTVGVSVDESNACESQIAP